MVVVYIREHSCLLTLTGVIHLYRFTDLILKWTVRETVIGGWSNTGFIKSTNISFKQPPIITPILSLVVACGVFYLDTGVEFSTVPLVTEYSSSSALTCWSVAFSMRLFQWYTFILDGIKDTSRALVFTQEWSMLDNISMIISYACVVLLTETKGANLRAVIPG